MNILEDLPSGGGSGGSWYHASVKTVSRGAGRSAVAAAAYRLGARLHDEQTDLTHDYTRRGGVNTSFILAPAGAPEWAFNPEAFWNAAEKAEKRKDSRVARELELALPAALTDAERKALVLRAAQYLVDRFQVGVSVAIHAPGKHGDDRNHHAHLLFSTRRIGDGFGEKTRELDDKTQGAREITAIRKHTCFLINEALEAAGHAERVDYRSFSARGIAREGTRHLGPAAHQMAVKGKGSRRQDANQEIEAGNSQVQQIVVDLAALAAELRAVEEALLDERYGALDGPDTPPPMPVAPEPDAGGSVAPIAAPSGKPDWWHERRSAAALDEAQAEALMQQAAAPFLAQIHEHGCLQDGEPDGLRFHERIAARTAELWRQGASWARGTWQGLIANWRGRDDLAGQEPGIER